MKMKLNFFTRTLLILLVLGSTVLYSVWRKSEIESALRHPDAPILKALPTIEMQTIDKEPIKSADLLKSNYKAIYVHFWATWCAPCEAEFPSLIEFTKKLSDQNVLFLLVAVNDEEMKVRKFLKEKVKELPLNTKIILDDGRSLPEFGTVKVPETYLFNGQGITLKKYIGSLDWARPSIVEEFQRLTK